MSGPRSGELFIITDPSPIMAPHRMGLVTNDHATPGTMLPVARVAWPQFPAPLTDNVLLFTGHFRVGSRRHSGTWECPEEGCYNVTML